MVRNPVLRGILAGALLTLCLAACPASAQNVQAIQFSTNPVRGGTTTLCRVSLDRPAGPHGQIVQVRSFNGWLAWWQNGFPQDNIWILPGATSVTTVLYTARVYVPQRVLISATTGGSSPPQYNILTVTP